MHGREALKDKLYAETRIKSLCNVTIKFCFEIGPFLIQRGSQRENHCWLPFTGFLDLVTFDRDFLLWKRLLVHSFFIHTQMHRHQISFFVKRIQITSVLKLSIKIFFKMALVENILSIDFCFCIMSKWYGKLWRILQLLTWGQTMIFFCYRFCIIENEQKKLAISIFVKFFKNFKSESN